MALGWSMSERPRSSALMSVTIRGCGDAYGVGGIERIDVGFAGVEVLGVGDAGGLRQVVVRTSTRCS